MAGLLLAFALVLVLVMPAINKVREVSKRLRNAGTGRVFIEGVQPGQQVEYYLAATSNSGRQETLPRTAPKGSYSFTVEKEQ